MEKMKKDIKIFVSHRIDLDSETIDNPLFIPVRCGAVYDKRENITMLGDNTGDNISEKRNSFCELTVQYWAWKNVKADYYGLCHYRRYLSFASQIYSESKEERNNGCVSENYITKKVLEKYGINENTMRKIIEDNDVLVCKAIRSSKNNYDSMKMAKEYHNIDDMDMTIKIINKLYPEMKDIVREYMSSYDVRLYNCFIMKKDIFNNYCEWLFSILFELENSINMEYYGVQKYRTPGTIGERLFGIYCLYLKKSIKVKLKELQLMFLENTEKQYLLKPYFGENQITIVSNFNNNYVSIFSVFLLSALKYLNTKIYYEFIILSEDISEENKEILNQILISYKNIKITFYNPFYLLNDIKLFVDNPVYSKDLYVRVIIPYILKLYNKVLVVDADTICKTDLTELYNIDLQENVIGAVRDVVYFGYLNGVVPGTLEYAKNTLNLKNPYNYCNTGVLLMDCNKIRKIYDLNTVLNHINNHPYRIYEQDMINVLFDEKILFLDSTWNVFTYTNPTIEHCVKMAPFNDYLTYMEGRKNPKIIHYAAHPKPWWVSEADFGYEFWRIAKQSPYYERLLSQVAWFQANNLYHSHDINYSKKHIQRLVDLLLPRGSKKREYIKKLIPKDSFIGNLSRKIYNKL